MTEKSRGLRLLHLHSSFAASVPALRCVHIINAFGPGCAHRIVAADGNLDAATAIDRRIAMEFAQDFPDLRGHPTPARLQRLAGGMVGHDLVLTYGYDAIDAALAHTLFGGSMPTPPLVHHEDDAGAQPSGQNRLVRNWYRRIALGRAAAVVVPSRQLESIAVEAWHQPRSRVKHIAPGIRVAAFAARPRRDALPRVIKREGELWLGVSLAARPGQDPDRLVRAFAVLPEPWHWVVLGEDPAREAIRDAALRLDLGHRVHLPGRVDQPATVMGLFDLFADLSDSGKFSLPIIEAMAAGLAVVARGHDAVALLAPENAPYVVPRGDEAALATALRSLAERPDLRARIGAANRARARAEYDEAAMVTACRTVYGAALGRRDFP